MYFSKEDLEIFKRLDFPQKPVAIALTIRQPKGIERLDDKIRVCDMVSLARKRAPFYTGSENHTCEAGWSVLGYGDPPHAFTSGTFACELSESIRERVHSAQIDVPVCADYVQMRTFELTG